MKPERWQQIDQLFHEALEHQREDRPAFLDTACAGDPDLRREVDSLLRLEDSAENFLELPALQQAAVQLARDAPDEFTDPKIPGYSIIKMLGEGGMGVVYHAQQTEPIHRRVALKLIKHGMDTRHVIARFEIERQALALMQHPHIAAVYDAGSTRDGRPYFVMEYVEGVPITDYCDQHRLSTRARLELFVDVCAAVQHAHQKGVIHRDLKPSNVLVSDEGGRPFPKIIDFGVAKAVAIPLTERTSFTEHGVLLGTPEYMSPEQAALSHDIDTTTDVYSLGVLLYELLVGALPFDPKVLRAAGYDEMRRIIQESEPIRPSARLSSAASAENLSATARQLDAGRFTRQLKGDLDWITLKALEKDRSRRYQTVAAFAADVTHFLADEPISARAPSAAYRLGKFTRRYRGAVIAAAAVFLALVAGLVASLILIARLEDERREGVRQRLHAALATTEADRQRTIATNEGEAASVARRETEYRDFTAAIRNADAELNLNNAEGALRYLTNVPSGLRNFEWHHLLLKTNPSLVNLSSRVSCDPPGQIDSSPAIISDHVVTVKGERLYLRRCTTLEVWDRQRNTYGKYVFPGKILAVSATGEVLTVASAGSGPDKRWNLLVADPVLRQNRPALGPFGAEPICADFSRDGRRLAVGLRPQPSSTGAQDIFQVWDVPAAVHLQSLAPPKPPLPDTRARPVNSCLVTFSPDSSRLATSGAKVDVWRTDTWEELVPDTSQAGHVAQPVAWDADGSRLAIGRLTGLVDILDLTSKPRFDRLDGDGKIRVLPLPDGDRPSLVAARKASEVLSITFSPDGTKVVTGRDVSLFVWDLAQRKLARVLDGHYRGVIGIAFDSNGQIVSADWGGLVNIWPATLTVSAAISVLQGSRTTSGAFVLSRNGAVLGIAQTDGGLFAWSLSDLRKTVIRPGTGALDVQLARSLAITPDGKKLFAAEVDAVGTVRPWSLNSGLSGPPLRLNARIQPGCENVEPASTLRAVDELAISGDGQWLAHRQGRCVIVSDAVTGAVKRRLPRESTGSFVFLSDNSLLLVASPPRQSKSGPNQMKALIWDWLLDDVRIEVSTPPTRTASENASWKVAASADGRYVALVGGRPAIVVIWDGKLEKELGLLPVQPETEYVAFSTDGLRLASAGPDSTVRIWDVERLQFLLPLMDDDGHKGGLAFTPDGRLIAGRASGGLTIWETRKK